MRRTATVLLTLLLAGGCGGDRVPDPAYVAEVDAWHAGRVARLTTDTGWLTLVGLHALAPGTNTLGSGEDAGVRLTPAAPPRLGAIELAADGAVAFRADPQAQVFLAGDPQRGPVTALDLATDAAGEPTVLSCGSLLLHVIDRGGRLFLRVKDRQAEALRTFTGIDRFPVDPRWRVTARLEPGTGTVRVPNVLGQVDEEPSPGTLVFTLDGTECRLVPTGAPGQDLFIVFGDRSNGPETYPGGRFLSAGPPADDGTVVLDFNRAVNPPCAFSDFATCPLPPAGNTLPLADTAGEKRWGSH